ncbi:MAG TPA: HAD family hydrolase [Anaerolineales bacterium]|nr:HAD family hydrolase [Anaerolineales bacterium]
MFSPNGITTILFDLDGTLRHSRPTMNQAFYKFAVELGLPESAEGCRAALRWLHYYWAQSPELLADLETYQGKEESFWLNHARLHLLAFGCPEDRLEALAPEISRRMYEEYEPEEWISPEVPEMLQALKQAGFTLGVVSNRTKPFGELLETLQLRSYFDYVLAAGEIKAWKPEPKIFQHALAMLGASPEQTLYIGDNYYADVVGAERAGLRPILLDPEGTFSEAACPVIQTIGQLAQVLEKELPGNALAD